MKRRGRVPVCRAEVGWVGGIGGVWGVTWRYFIRSIRVGGGAVVWWCWIFLGVGEGEMGSVVYWGLMQIGYV